MINEVRLGRQDQRPAGAAGGKQEQGADENGNDTHGWNPKSGLQC
jgi:hypothetical protein